MVETTKLWRTHTDADGDVKDESEVWVTDTTLHWIHARSRRTGAAWQVEASAEKLSRWRSNRQDPTYRGPWQGTQDGQGEQAFATVEEAEKAAQALIAARKEAGLVVREAPVVGAPRPPEGPSLAKKGAATPAWFASLPKPLVAQGAKLRKKAQAKGLGHRFAEIEALMRPGMDLALKKAKPADLKGIVSRIGGDPDLPPGHDWPAWGGAPLTFVAQIVIAPDVKEIDLEGLLPKEGVLSFFAQLDPGAPEYGDRCAVLHFPTAEGLTRTAPPSPACVLKSAGIFTPKARLTVAPSEAPAVEALGLHGDEQGAYHDDLFLGPIPEGRHHMLLGWPNATTYHDLKGKRFLAQFDSDHRLGFEMGDYDTLRIYIDGDAVDASTLKTAVCTLGEA